jgi:hypothetical protein
MSVPFKGSYSIDSFDASKRYRMQFQKATPLSDNELLDIGEVSNSFVQELVAVNFSRGSSPNDGFKVIESSFSNVNNFTIKGGDATVNGAGILFVDGYILFLKSDIEYTAQQLTSSSTSMTIGVGTQSPIVGPGLPLLSGQQIVISTYDKNNTMSGTITSYDTGTGEIVANITSITGAGAYSAWTISSPSLLVLDSYTSTLISGLTTPGSSRTDYVYVDFYFAEVSADTQHVSEYVDPSLIVADVGRITANRIRQVQDIKVAEGVAMPTDDYDSAGIFHRYVKIATISRLAGNNQITSAMIQDERTFVNSNAWFSEYIQLMPDGTVNIGDNTHRITTIYMASSIDYDTDLAFIHSSSEKMRLSIGGNLGIGTTTPGSLLQINGGAAIGFSSSTSAPSNGLTVRGRVGIGTLVPGANLEIAATTLPEVLFTPTSGDSVIDTTTGNLLIKSAGTTQLNVSSTGVTIPGDLTVNGITEVINTHTTTSDKMLISQSTDNVALGVEQTGSGNSAIVMTINNAGSGPALTIIGTGTGSSGRVGIGTISPLSNLHVDGLSTVALTLGWGDGLSSSRSLHGVIETNTGDIIGSMLKVQAWASNSGNTVGTLECAKIDLYKDTQGGNGYNTSIRFHTKTGTGDTLAEQMRITCDGNVGIGTINPGARLELSTPSTSIPTLIISRASGQSSIKSVASEDLILESGGSSHSVKLNYYSTDNVLLCEGGGKVGINASSPGSSLQVGSGGTTERVIISSQRSTHSQLQIGNPASNAEASINFNSGVTAFGDSPTSVNGTTNIWGIGAGAYGVGGNKFGIGNEAFGDSILTIQSNGCVGVGTTGPLQKLHISGTSLFEGNIRSGANSALSSGSPTDPAITVGGYTHAGIYFENSGVGLGSGAGNYLFLNSSGGVGIGIAPAADVNSLYICNRLCVGTSTSSSMGLTVNTSTSDPAGTAAIANFASTLGNFYIFVQSGNVTQMQSSGGMQVISPSINLPGTSIGYFPSYVTPPNYGLAVSGRVGIGTNIPDSELEVVGNIHATASGYLHTEGGVNCDGNLNVYSSAGISGSLHVEDNSSFDAILGAGSLVVCAPSPSPQPTPTQLLHVYGGSSLGIGLTLENTYGGNPGKITIEALGGLQIIDDNASTTRLTIDNSGNLGVGALSYAGPFSNVGIIKANTLGALSTSGSPTTDLTDWSASSSPVGFDSVSIKSVWYKIVDGMCHLFYYIYGPGDASGLFSFTLPIELNSSIAAAMGGSYYQTIPAVVDNAQQSTPGLMNVGTGVSHTTANLYKNCALGGWSSNVAKGANGYICYPV